MSVGKLVSHGSAPYKDDPENSRSYFVELEHEGRTQKIWGIDLANAMEETTANIGDVVTVNNLGSKTVEIPDPKDPSKTKIVKRNDWEVEKYESQQNLENAIEHDVERELQKTQVVNKTKENEGETNKQNKPKLSDFEATLPDNIKNNYIAITKNRSLDDEKVNYYDKTDPDKVNIAFEDRKNSLNTSRQDDKTVKAMMDLAESKGWTAIKLKGTEEFKQKAWIEASLRGIETKGYEPTEKDKAELIAKQEIRTVNNVEATAIKEPQEQVAPTQPENLSTEPQAPDDEIFEPIQSNIDDWAYPTDPRQFTTHEEATAIVHQELLNHGWEMKDDGRGMFPTKTFLDKDNKEHHIQVTDYDYVLHISSKQKVNEKAQQTAHIHGENLSIYTDKEIASDIVKDIEQKVQEYANEANLTVHNQSSEFSHSDTLEQRHEKALSLLEALDTNTVQALSEDEYQSLYNTVEDPLYSSEGDLFKALRTGNEAWIQEAKIYADTNKIGSLPVEMVNSRYALSEQMNTYLAQNKVNEQVHIAPTEVNKTLDEKDIKAQIREITQNGYKAGTITNRNDLVNALTDHGYEVVKENEKSIRLKIPYSDQHLTLKGEMFTKDFDAIKQLKSSLEPDTIKERYPQISDTGIAQITAWKNYVLEKYETPQAQQEFLNRLETSIVDVANGKDLGMPQIPDNEIQPDIQIQIATTDKSRSR